jgi:hypothetical protein
MATPENTKLCNFTSTNNSDFIYTPIVLPAPATNFYEIKPALLNLVMKEQFSGASTDDATAERPPGFSLRRRHGYVPAERIHVRIPGHTGWILGSYLHDIFQPRHSSLVAMTQLDNHISQSCLTVSIYKISELSFATLINSSRWE